MKRTSRITIGRGCREARVEYLVPSEQPSIRDFRTFRTALPPGKDEMPTLERSQLGDKTSVDGCMPSPTTIKGIKGNVGVEIWLQPVQPARFDSRDPICG